MLNKVIIMGRLTANPELRQTPSGVSVCRIRVAVDRDYTPQGQEKQTDFIDVTAWRQTAEFVSRYFSKGNMICVEGSLRSGSYTDRKYSDVTHYTLEIYADRIYFTGEKANGGGNGNFEHAAPQTNGGNQQQIPQQNAQSAPISIGDLGDFEEVIGDGDVPF